ncbi:hypothetical protein HYV80_04090 [Candidatus Woesearchaeota archaeon]|nr:hypothetical protein [Candidatus Woesearchaeota archaeon]MBI3027656.1 hypothetical protein [Candidatus Woesearchaeota archaeon]
MNDVMVSIRMPKALVAELKELAQSHHFLDLSEEVRSIVRQKWLRHAAPELFELKKLREEIEKEIKRKSVKKLQQQVANELEKIKTQLKQEGFVND